MKNQRDTEETTVAPAQPSTPAEEMDLNNLEKASGGSGYIYAGGYEGDPPPDPDPNGTT